jgi:hypothetical protein
VRLVELLLLSDIYYLELWNGIRTIHSLFASYPSRYSKVLATRMESVKPGTVSDNWGESLPMPNDGSKGQGKKGAKNQKGGKKGQGKYGSYNQVPDIGNNKIFWQFISSSSGSGRSKHSKESKLGKDGAKALSNLVDLYGLNHDMFSYRERFSRFWCRWRILSDGDLFSKSVVTEVDESKVMTRENLGMADLELVKQVSTATKGTTKVSYIIIQNSEFYVRNIARP